MLMVTRGWSARGVLVATLLLGLALEILLFMAISRFDLFVAEDTLRDRLLLLGLTLGFVAMSAQVLHTLWGVGRIAAMTMVTLATMWAWAAVLVLAAFLVFLLFFALFFELYLPVHAAAWAIQRGLSSTRKSKLRT